MSTRGRAVAYIRVSSRSQDHSMQRSQIAKLARAREDSIGTWYSEKKTAKHLARPELSRLREDARRGIIKRLYLFKLDRLTRSGIRDTLNVIHELRGHGVELISVSESFSLAGPESDMILAALAWAAQMERLAINERISAAREHIEENGGHWGRPPRMDDAAVAKLVSLRRQGRTVRELAQALKVPRSTIADTLRRQGLSGKDGPNSRRPRAGAKAS